MFFFILFSIYITGLVFKWILKNGGVDYFHELNTKKSKLLYDTIDDSLGFYKPIINEGSRSRVNIVFRVGGPQGDSDVEKKFVEKAKENGLAKNQLRLQESDCFAKRFLLQRDI